MLVNFKGHLTIIKMIDRIIYNTLDWIVSKCEQIREWRIRRSLPKVSDDEVKKWTKSRNEK